MNHKDIQGNVLAAFNKPHMHFLMLRLPRDADAARAWLDGMAGQVATGDAVAKHNALVDQGRAKSATWIGLGLTWSGLEKLEAPDLDRALADDYAFRVGPEARAADLGDVGASAPARWRFGAAASPVDAVVTVAADDEAGLKTALKDVERLAAAHGATLPDRIAGARLTDGSAHFGFKDGGSQPVVEGPDADAKPGEFVLGEESANPPREDLPPWLRNASFQVLRVLEQDVRRWRAVPEATRTDWVGRSPDGSPLKKTPAGSHVGKAVPAKKFGPERRRLMRRGIPYGPSFDDDPQAERGLIFNAFMASIGRQYEYVQCLWANRSDFPKPRTGADPVIGAPDALDARYPPAGLSSAARYVTTRAAVYAVAPGIAGLRALAGGERRGGVLLKAAAS
jgi:Dyp-type peroxidase family